MKMGEGKEKGKTGKKIAKYDTAHVILLFLFFC